MKLIGAGFSRTGTISLQEALITLGLPCYHFFELMSKDADLDIWYKYSLDPAGSPLPYKALLEGYEACLDFPICVHYRELMEEFPDAKVILTVRDAEKWRDSLAKIFRTCGWVIVFALVCPRLLKVLVIGVRASFVDTFKMHLDRANWIEAFNQHVAEVKAAVPPEKLLVFDVREGWEPLCKFLDCPVPDAAFPHKNKGMSAVQRKILTVVWRDLTDVRFWLRLALVVGSIVALVYASMNLVF